MIKKIRSTLVHLLLMLLVACGAEKIELISDVQEQDANEIVAALLESGIDAEKNKLKKSLSVMILKRDMAVAMEVLNAKGLPNRHHSNLGEIFKKEGMVSTPLEERARYIYDLSQELEYTLSQIDGVLVARVHVVLPERVAPGQPIQPPSAAILIKHLPLLDPDAISNKIRRVVISSIPGLSSVDFERISLSFVVSNAQLPAVKLVKVGKYLLTEDSAKDLRQTLFWGTLALAVMMVGGIVSVGYYFIFYPKKKAKSKSVKEHKTLDSSEEDANFFNGDEIVP